jgi:D-arabinose 1-dehydrogenase-like Zn-dependent alcohol dehydrogenase
MLAAVLAGDRQVRVEEVPVPEPGEGQVRLRLEGCGVCASNVPVWEGRPWFSYPFEPGSPGHEGWGIVDAIGPGVAGVRPGDRVAALSYHAYAEYDLADAASIVKLPAELDGIAVPGEPLGCAVNVLRRSNVRPGDTVAIVGIGFLGALLVQLATNAGARVIAISRRPSGLDLARQFGAEETIAYDDRQRVVQSVFQRTGSEGCDRVIEVTGKQEPLDLAADLTRVRGRLIIAGYHQDGLRLGSQSGRARWCLRGARRRTITRPKTNPPM